MPKGEFEHDLFHAKMVDLGLEEHKVPPQTQGQHQISSDDENVGAPSAQMDVGGKAQT